MSEGQDILKKFVDEWKSFKLSRPKHRRWSADFAEWLWVKYYAWFEYYVDPNENTKKLDAAIWLNKKGGPPTDSVPMDLAIEWEWGREWTDKYNKKFATGDFVKLLTVPAKAGLAIIGTSAYGKQEKTKLKRKKAAEKIIKNIKKSYAKNKNKKDNRPIGVIEVRLVDSKALERKYECWYHNLSDDKQPIRLNKFSCRTGE